MALVRLPITQRQPRARKPRTNEVRNEIEERDARVRHWHISKPTPDQPKRDAERTSKALIKPEPIRDRKADGTM